MSSSARQLARVISRPVKKLQKPRPLKTPNASRHSSVDTTNLNVFEEIMVLVEAVASNLSSGNFDRNLQSNVVSMNGLLKSYGRNLEVIYKDQLDRAFVIFRNGCRDENLDYISRLYLLELIELRAMNWMVTDNTTYYKHKFNHPDVDMLSLSSNDSFNLNSANAFQNSQILNSGVPQPLLLGPGELVKSSGTFPVPTMIPEKNYYKDEVVIRNSDSGKVMGIKGKRVHTIEELSETVISFQRVNPGAKERLVQIIGFSEDKIVYAKQLMEETIKRNASPVRTEMDKEKHGSNSSLNSSASEDSSRYGSLNDSSKRTTLLHSFSTSDATIGEYKYTVTIGEDTLKITGTNPDLVTIAKLVLDEYFLPESNDQLVESGLNEKANFLGRLNVPEDDNDVNRSATDETVIKIESEESNTKEAPTLVEGRNFISAISTDVEKQNFLNVTNDSIETTKILPIIKYSIEKLIMLAESPLSRRTPDDWPRIVKNCPKIVQKPRLSWIDSKTYLKERQQEIDKLILVEDVKEQTLTSPEPE